MLVNLEEKLQLVPDKPGVYLFYGSEGEVIYVGKAASLKNRVRSYFRSSQNHSPKVLSMVKSVEDLEYIVTDNEVEALILEFNLIKKYRPKYNVMFRDDKSYPYLKITLNEEWPGIEITRNVVQDGSRYFGPYTSAGALHETLRLLRRLFPIRTCRGSSYKKRERPCLNAHIKRCLAPCSGRVDAEKYREMINELILFLEGKQESLISRLEEKMLKASENLEFEKAAEIRDQIRSIKAVLEKQKIVSPGGEDQDVIAMAKGKDETCVQVFFVREGKLIGREHFFLDGTEGMPEEEIMSVFLKQYYSRATEIPHTVLLSHNTEDKEVIEKWLKEKRGKKVTLKVPLRGPKKDLVEMVAQNALMELKEHEREQSKKIAETEEALLQLKEYLDLNQLPLRIEGYDVSNISGTNNVGVMVVFENGVPQKRHYRRFKINSTSGPDDYQSMRELIYRRFKRAESAEKSGTEIAGEGDIGFSTLPDLVVIDGGKGQLKSAREVMRSLGVEDIPTFALAKKREELFKEGRKDPYILPRNSQALFLLQRIRDEAHRFAVTYHRRLRGKQMSRSVLDEVPGIGPKRKKALLRKYGSVEGIRKASVEELAQVEGMNKSAAEKLLEYLGGK